MILLIHKYAQWAVSETEGNLNSIMILLIRDEIEKAIADEADLNSIMILLILKIRKKQISA